MEGFYREAGRGGGGLWTDAAQLKNGCTFYLYITSVGDEFKAPNSKFKCLVSIKWKLAFSNMLIKQLDIG